MPAPDVSRIAKSDETRNRLKTFLITLLVLVVLTAVPLALLDSAGRSALREQIAAMKAADEPLSLVEYEARRPELPDEENSALVILSLQADLQDVASRNKSLKALPFLGTARLPDWSEPWPQEVLNTIEDLLTEEAELLHQLDVVHDLPQGRLHIDLDQNPILTVLPDLKAFRLACKLQALAALHDSVRGEHNDALERCQTMLHIGASVRDEPTLICSLVSIAVDGVAVDALERILAVGSGRPELLATLQGLLLDHETHGAMPNGLRAERLFQVDIHEYVRQNGLQGINNGIAGGPNVTWPKSLNWMLGGLIRLNQAKAMELMAPLIDVLDNPRKALDAVRAFDNAAASLPRQYFVVKIILPSLSRAVTLWVRQTALLRCARAGLAAERFRLDTGHWPGTLDDLVPDYLDAIPIDPFDGKPLRYKIDPDMITIYSVSEDGKDDGGQLTRPDRRRDPTPDIGFRLLNPELRGVRIAEPTPQEDAGPGG